MKVAVYYRVSTRGQGDDDRLGLPTQRQAVTAFCAKEGHEIVRTFQDVGFSGATADRPGLAEMLEADGFEAVVVYKWDRLARDAKLDGFLRYNLDRRGIRVLSATEANGIDPMAVLVQGILASVAGYERHLITQRLAGARRVKASQGGYAHGQAPYGSKAAGGKLVINDAEFQTLEIIRQLRKDGLTIRAIVDQLNADGRPTRNGKPWGPSSVHGALKSVERIDAVTRHDNKVQSLSKDSQNGQHS